MRPASAVLVGRTTADPLGRLRDAMLGVAAGDLDVELPALGRADEIGQMAKAVATFKEAALDRRRLEREAHDQRAIERSASDKATKPNARRGPKSRNRSSPSSPAATSNCREEILTYRIAEDFPPAYQKTQGRLQRRDGAIAARP